MNDKKPDTDPKTNEQPEPNDKSKREREREREHDQDLLDEGVEESFPASDPPSVSHID